MCLLSNSQYDVEFRKRRKRPKRLTAASAFLEKNQVCAEFCVYASSLL